LKPAVDVDPGDLGLGKRLLKTATSSIIPSKCLISDSEAISNVIRVILDGNAPNLLYRPQYQDSVHIDL
jgi:hypothetical protein